MLLLHGKLNMNAPIKGGRQADLKGGLGGVGTNAPPTGGEHLSTCNALNPQARTTTPPPATLQAGRTARRAYANMAPARSTNQEITRRNTDWNFNQRDTLESADALGSSGV